MIPLFIMMEVGVSLQVAERLDPLFIPRGEDGLRAHLALKGLVGR